MKKPTLLLVDDEPNVLRALERVFDEDGYHIITANSGQEALKILEETSVQVIISDQRMPQMTGSEFLAQVKIKYPDIVRIILSGYTEYDSLKIAINEGLIYKYYNKPWDEENLREGIRDAFLINVQFKEKERQLIRLINFAKLSGVHHDKSSDVDAVTEGELGEALEKNQFILNYQPIVYSNTGIYSRS